MAMGLGFMLLGTKENTKKKDRNQWKYHTLANKVEWFKGEFKHVAKNYPKVPLLSQQDVWLGK